MTDNIIVRGSYGTLTVHRSSGTVLDYNPGGDADGDLGYNYSTIRWFDPARLPDRPECDILDTAFVDQFGYCRELVWWPDSQVWEDPLLLPAPTQH